jgi:hypothetical protein
MGKKRGITITKNVFLRYKHSVHKVIHKLSTFSYARLFAFLHLSYYTTATTI